MRRLQKYACMYAHVHIHYTYKHMYKCVKVNFKYAKSRIKELFL